MANRLLPICRAFSHNVNSSLRRTLSYPMDATPDELSARFPWPSLPHPAVVPAPIRHAGWNSESTDTVLTNLKVNHQRWHIFFNEMHFHKCAFALSCIELEELMDWLQPCRAPFARDICYGRTSDSAECCVSHACCVPEARLSSTRDRRSAEGERGHRKGGHRRHELEGIPRRRAVRVLTPLVGHSLIICWLYARYYQAYVAFFARKLSDKSAGKNAIQQVLEDYIFSIDANLTPGENAHGHNPLMLSRFLGGFLHPLIHAGYGAEFGLPGLIAEGAPGHNIIHVGAHCGLKVSRKPQFRRAKPRPSSNPGSSAPPAPPA